MENKQLPCLIELMGLIGPLPRTFPAKWNGKLPSETYTAKTLLLRLEKPAANSTSSKRILQCQLPGTDRKKILRPGSWVPPIL